MQIYIYAEEFHEISSAAHKILELIFSFAVPDHAIQLMCVMSELRQKVEKKQNREENSSAQNMPCRWDLERESTKKRSHK